MVLGAGAPVRQALWGNKVMGAGSVVVGQPPRQGEGGGYCRCFQMNQSIQGPQSTFPDEGEDVGWPGTFPCRLT